QHPQRRQAEHLGLARPIRPNPQPSLKVGDGSGKRSFPGRPEGPTKLRSAAKQPFYLCIPDKWIMQLHDNFSLTIQEDDLAIAGAAVKAMPGEDAVPHWKMPFLTGGSDISNRRPKRLGNALTGSNAKSTWSGNMRRLETSTHY